MTCCGSRLLLGIVYGSRYSNFRSSVCCGRRSQWPRGLRRRSTAARLLRSWFRIPRGAWMFVVSVVCCQVEVSATSWSLVQRSPTDWRVVVCHLETTKILVNGEEHVVGDFFRKAYTLNCKDWSQDNTEAMTIQETRNVIVGIVTKERAR
jgi:hypothetical protein